MYVLLKVKKVNHVVIKLKAKVVILLSKLKRVIDLIIIFINKYKIIWKIYVLLKVKKVNPVVIKLKAKVAILLSKLKRVINLIIIFINK